MRRRPRSRLERLRRPLRSGADRSSAQRLRLRGPVLYGSEGATVIPTARPVVPSVASLLTGQVLRDGETILLMLKPSRWQILLSSLGFIGGVLILLCAMQIMRAPHIHYFVEAAIFLIAGRCMWGMLSWMSRLYVLTDQRIVRLSGVLSVEMFECPLRKVARTRLAPTSRERLLRLGSIEIIPSDEDRPGSIWQTIRRPAQVQEQIQTAIRRARQGGCGIL